MLVNIPLNFMHTDLSMASFKKSGQIKVKVKLFLSALWRRVGEKTLSSTHSEALLCVAMSGQPHSPAVLLPKINSFARWIWRRVGPRNSKSHARSGIQNADRQIHSCFLYRLSYRGSLLCQIEKNVLDIKLLKWKMCCQRCGRWEMTINSL
jgi:hypothetical protein